MASRWRSFNPVGNIRLPQTICEYNEGGATVYRTKQLSYLTTSDYISSTRRIIGLPTQEKLFAGNLATLIAQTDYQYDCPAEAGITYLQDHANPVSQHEGGTANTAYQTSGQPRRGNLNKVMRYRVTSSTASAPVTVKTGYNSTGTVACTKDALNNETKLFYDDAFTLGVTTNPPKTYAYPTKASHIESATVSYSSMLKYHYDHGGVTETIDPKAYATSSGTKVVTLYDTKGRVERTKVVKEGVDYSYTRNVYGNDHNWMQTWSTVNSLSLETSVLHMLDGLGRERITGNEHPGSSGGLSLQYVVYDIVGRVVESSNPAEVNSTNWAPFGDDAAGYTISTQAYDWKGRPTSKSRRCSRSVR